MIRRVLSDSVVYGLTRYASAIAAIFLTPIYTRMLLKEDYGAMDIFNSLNTLIIQVLPLGMTTAAMRFYPTFKEDPALKRKSFGTILVALTILGIIYCLAMLAMEGFFVKKVFKLQGYEAVYRVCIFLVFGSMFMNYFQSILIAKLEKTKYLISSLTNFVLLSGLGFLFVYYFKTGIIGFFVASAIGMMVSLSLSLYFIRGDLGWEFDRQRLREILGYSIHLVSAMVLFELANLLDRYILVTFGNLNDVGVYSIGARIANITQLFVSGFSMAWFPLAMSISKQANAKEIYSRVNTLYVLLGAFFVSSLILFRSELLAFFTPDYLEASNTIGILTVFNYVAGSIYVFTLGLHTTGRTRAISRAAVASVVVNAVSSVGLYSLFGIEGVAIGTLLGGIVWIGIQFYDSQKHYPIEFDKWSMLISSIGLISVFGLSLLLDRMEWTWFQVTGLRVSVLLLFLLIVFVRLGGTLSALRKTLLGHRGKA